MSIRHTSRIRTESLIWACGRRRNVYTSGWAGRYDHSRKRHIFEASLVATTGTDLLDRGFGETGSRRNRDTKEQLVRARKGESKHAKQT
jgi:hypothetical protein